MSAGPVIIAVRCDRSAHAVRAEVRDGSPVVVASNHDEPDERVLVALGGKRARCLAVVDGLRALAGETGASSFMAWVEAGVRSRSDLRAWQKVGVRSPDEVAAWAVLGEATPKAAGDWVRAGVESAPEAVRWVDAGVTSPLDVRAWRDAGTVDPDEIRAWSAVGITHPSARRMWGRLTPSPIAVPRWRAAGVRTPEEAAQWGRARVRSVRDLQRWRALGIDADEASAWAKARIDVREVAAWRAAGVRNGADAVLWRRGGAMSPDDVRAFLDGFVGASDVGAWHDVGCRTADDVDRWFAHGLGDEALRWRRVAGVDGALAWRGAGVSTPEDAQRWMDLRGFVWPAEIALWRGTGVITIDAAEALTARDNVPVCVTRARRAEAARLGLDSAEIGGVPDFERELDGRFPGKPALSCGFFYRADWRRVKREFADLVCTAYYDVTGEPLPDLDDWEWLPRVRSPDEVAMRVDCDGSSHVLVARRVRRQWTFDSDHDVAAERTLAVLGGSPPRCVSAAEAFRALVGLLPVDRAAAWAETGAVLPSDGHPVWVGKAKHRPVTPREVVRLEVKGMPPVQVGERFGGDRTARAYVARSCDALLLQPTRTTDA